jgi:hypothetical protein
MEAVEPVENAKSAFPTGSWKTADGFPQASTGVLVFEIPDKILIKSSEPI